MTREATRARRARARDMFVFGAKPADIAVELGVNRTTVWGWVRDLVPTDRRRRRRWTPETVVEAIRQVADEQGSRARPAQFTPPPRGSGLPSMSTIIQVCGSWRTALKLAEADPTADRAAA